VNLSEVVHADELVITKKGKALLRQSISMNMAFGFSYV
jgi:hypothetical protein